MLRVLGSARTLCDQLTRRELLQVGGMGVGGLTLASLLQAQAQGATGGVGFGQAKRCILLYLYGAPSQLETFDMKPEAPVEIRGTMQPIPSSVPGIDVCEYLPETARIMDRTTVVRSVTHPFPLHGVAFATSGIPAIDAPMELAPHDPRHHPYFGSCVEYIQRQSRAKIPTDIPQNIALPFPFSTQRTGEVHRAGPYAAYLGAAYNPVWTEYSGHATRSVEKTLNTTKLDCFDPYVACSDDSHFKLALTTPQADVTLDRLDRRRTLLQQFEQSRSELDQSVASRTLDRYQEMAFALISSRKVSEALDVRREPVATRDLYGRTLFGQACLAARRMVEAGSRMVSVFWDEYGLAGDAWDTHWNHFPRMQEQLMPGFDRAFSGLILDLERRGLLDDTLVACLSDHGRTPKLNNAKGGGRDHWSRVYSAIFAGGGIARGRVVGASDRHASDPTDHPVSPKDLLATMYHLLGIDPHAMLPDRSGRPIGLVPDGCGVIPEMLA